MKRRGITILVVLTLLTLVAAFPRIPSAGARQQDLTTSAAQNKAIVLQFLSGGLNKRNFALVASLLAPNVRFETPLGVTVGLKAYAATANAVITGVPDVHITVKEAIASGDTVAVRDITEGTQTGPFLGIPASGKKIHWSEFQFWHLSHGKIVAAWIQFDTGAVLRQIQGS